MKNKIKLLLLMILCFFSINSYAQIDDPELIITWNAPVQGTDVEYYILQISVSENGFDFSNYENWEIIINDDPLLPQFQFTGLWARYYLARVKAVDDEGNEGPWDTMLIPWSTSNAPDLPGRPGKPQIILINFVPRFIVINQSFPGSTVIEWSTNTVSTDLSHFKIERSIDDGEFELIESDTDIESFGLRYLDYGIMDENDIIDISYIISSVVTISGNEYVYSSESASIQLDHIKIPQSLQISYYNSDSIILNWSWSDVGKSLQGFRIYKFELEEEFSNSIIRLPVATYYTSSKESNHQYILSNVDQYKNYIYAVTAFSSSSINGQVESFYSDKITFNLQTDYSYTIDNYDIDVYDSFGSIRISYMIYIDPISSITLNFGIGDSYDEIEYYGNPIYSDGEISEVLVIWNTEKTMSELMDYGNNAYSIIYGPTGQIQIYEIVLNSMLEQYSSKYVYSREIIPGAPEEEQPFPDNPPVE